MLTEHEHRIVKVMISRGGSFVHHLGVCFRFADSKDFVRLKNAFPELWASYEKMLKPEPPEVATLQQPPDTHL